MNEQINKWNHQHGTISKCTAGWDDSELKAQILLLLASVLFSRKGFPENLDLHLKFEVQQLVNFSGFELVSFYKFSWDRFYVFLENTEGGNLFWTCKPTLGVHLFFWGLSQGWPLSMIFILDVLKYSQGCLNSLWDFEKVK